MENQKLKGVWQMIAAMSLFSVMQLLVKKLAYIPFYELIFVRSIVSLVLCYFTLNIQRKNLWGNDKKGLILRGVFGSLSLTCFFYALQRMPLGSLITIVNIKPFLVLLWATLFLNEKVKLWQWLCFGLCFIGIIWLKGIDTRLDLVTLLCAIAAALFASFAHTMVKKLGEKEDSNVILFYFALVCMPIFTPITIVNWVNPIGIGWIYALGIGLITHFAQLLLTRSYQIGQVSVVSNLYFLGIIFAFAIGYFVFKETYNEYQILAVLLVCIGILGNILVAKNKNML